MNFPVHQRNAEYYNSLEPDSLVSAFLHNAPHDFTIENIDVGGKNIHGFWANIDLFITLDEKASKAVDRLRKFRVVKFIISKCFTPKILFIGNTVSEYCLLPRGINLSQFKDKIQEIFNKSRRQLLIIKDIPEESVLLNADENTFARELTQFFSKNGFLILAGQALAYLPITFNSFDEYLKTFSAKKRTDFKRKLKAAAEVNMSIKPTGDAFFTDEVVERIYSMYLSIHASSDINFEKLTLDFFKGLLQNNSDGLVFIYQHNEKIIGFNICYIVEDYLVDKYWGASDDSQKFSLFFNHFFDNVKYCLEHKLKCYIIGWTAPRVKAYLGCSFTYTHHAIYIRNPLLRFILTSFKARFEGDKALIEAMAEE